MDPKPRSDEWMKRQAFLQKRGHPTEGHVMLIGNSLVKGILHWGKSARLYFLKEHKKNEV